MVGTYLALKWTGTLKVNEPPPTSGGGAGNGFARRTISSAFWSSVEDPVLPESRDETIFPLRLIVKDSDAVPLPSALVVPGLYLTRCA
jgi:hypothetical protein